MYPASSQFQQTESDVFQVYLCCCMLPVAPSLIDLQVHCTGCVHSALFLMNNEGAAVQTWAVYRQYVLQVLSLMWSSLVADYPTMSPSDLRL